MVVSDATTVVIGVEIVSPSGAFEYAEQHVSVAVDADGRLLTLTPGAGFYEFSLPEQRAWFRFDVSGLIVVTVTAA